MSIVSEPAKVTLSLCVNMLEEVTPIPAPSNSAKCEIRQQQHVPGWRSPRKSTSLDTPDSVTLLQIMKAPVNTMMLNKPPVLALSAQPCQYFERCDDCRP